MQILCTFSFLAFQFLSKSNGQVGKMGSGAIALSLPFSCILGLLASMTSTTMGKATLEITYLEIFSNS